MATLIQIYNAGFGDSHLHSMVVGAVIKIAVYILGEDGGVSNHANRLIWAKWILAKSQSEVQSAAEPFLMACAGNDSVLAEQPNYTDATVSYVVENFVNTVATGA